MEIGDIFVVNKGDMPGANKSASEITASLELAHFKDDWRPPVIVSIAETGQGIDELWQAAKKHKQFLLDSGLLNERRGHRIESELSEGVADLARRNLKEAMENSNDIRKVLQDIVDRQIDPHSAADGLIAKLFKDA